MNTLKIADQVAAALTETLERSTRDTPPITPTALQLAKEKRRKCAEQWKFKTFNEPCLEQALDAAIAFSALRPPAHWLSLIGQSGTGKTHLAEAVYSELFYSILSRHSSLKCGCQRAFWPKLVSSLRDGKYWIIDDLADANLTFIDEIAVEHDPSGFARDKLCELLSRRVGKWTILTSNLSLTKLGQIDTRISSRMIRGGSVVVEFNCIDYWLRPDTKGQP